MNFSNFRDSSLSITPRLLNFEYFRTCSKLFSIESFLEISLECSSISRDNFVVKAQKES